MIYLYNPRTNITKKITPKELMGITGLSHSAISHAKSRGSKLRSINCYLLDDEPSLKQRRHWYKKESYPDEHWVTVEGSDDEFHVSNYGRIKRIYKNGKERFMMPFQRKGKGNLCAKVRFLNRYGDHRIGHIVAHHFIRPRKVNERLKRKNGIITDDFAGNLEYVSLHELGKRTGHLAKSQAIVQLDLETGELINEFDSIREAGRELYLSHETIRLNCHGKTRHSGGYKFMFLEDFERMPELKVGV